MNDLTVLQLIKSLNVKNFKLFSSRKNEYGLTLAPDYVDYDDYIDFDFYFDDGDSLGNIQT